MFADEFPRRIGAEFLLWLVIRGLVGNSKYICRSLKKKKSVGVCCSIVGLLAAERRYCMRSNGVSLVYSARTRGEGGGIRYLFCRVKNFDDV